MPIFLNSNVKLCFSDEDDLPDNENDLKMPEEITSNKIEDGKNLIIKLSLIKIEANFKIALSC